MSDAAKIFWLVVIVVLVAIEGQYFYFPLQIYMLLIGLLFLAITVNFFLRFHKEWPQPIEENFRKLAQRKLEPLPEFNEQWKPIRHSMKSNDLNELRVTMIDADTLIEELLRAQGIQGDTMAALIAEATLLGILGTATLSRFHRLRNRIVHESTFMPKTEELRTALESVDKILVRWGVVLP